MFGGGAASRSVGRTDMVVIERPGLEGLDCIGEGGVGGGRGIVRVVYGRVRRGRRNDRMKQMGKHSN